ncbi:MAG: hypothetical protein RIS54_1718 [Verrucomicrobiota bacterium]|jgi:Ca-activated chloride channel family protein
MNFGPYTFAEPLWFLALVILPLLFWLRGRRRVSVLVVPFAAAWHRPSLTAASRWPAILATVGLCLVIVALARPQRVEDRREVNTKGYDIMLAIDLSGSMLAEDYETHGSRINRLQAVKPVIQAFIKDRPNDRIGIVVFAGQAYTLAPLTFDHAWLEKQTGRLRVGLIEDGTALGDGLGIALTRLEQAAREDQGRRQGAFVILLTDGANNRGALNPEQAAAIAASRGVPVYTIGAGRSGYVPMPIMNNQTGEVLGYHQVPSILDEQALLEIARSTGGHYFRAADSDTVEEAFTEIDKARKLEFQAKSYLVTTELFTWPAVPGLAALFLGALLARLPGRQEAAA